MIQAFLTWFGKIVRPANWIIFLSGIILFFVATYLWFFTTQDRLTVAILGIQGIQLTVEGYGEVKEDEEAIKK